MWNVVKSSTFEDFSEMMFSKLNVGFGLIREIGYNNNILINWFLEGSFTR